QRRPETEAEGPERRGREPRRLPQSAGGVPYVVMQLVEEAQSAGLAAVRLDVVHTAELDARAARGALGREPGTDEVVRVLLEMEKDLPRHLVFEVPSPEEAAQHRPEACPHLRPRPARRRARPRWRRPVGSSPPSLPATGAGRPRSRCSTSRA